MSCRPRRSCVSGSRLPFQRLAEYGEVERAEPGRDLYTSGNDIYGFFLLRCAPGAGVGPGARPAVENRPTSSRSTEATNSWTPTVLVDWLKREADFRGADARGALGTPGGSAPRTGPGPLVVAAPGGVVTGPTRRGIRPARSH